MSDMNLQAGDTVYKEFNIMGSTVVEGPYEVAQRHEDGTVTIKGDDGRLHRYDADTGEERGAELSGVLKNAMGATSKVILPPEDK